MLNESLKSQLQAYLQKIVQPVELIASLDESQGAMEMRSLLETIGSLTDKVPRDLRSNLLISDHADHRRHALVFQRRGFLHLHARDASP